MYGERLEAVGRGKEKAEIDCISNLRLCTLPSYNLSIVNDKGLPKPILTARVQLRVSKFQRGLQPPRHVSADPTRAALLLVFAEAMSHVPFKVRGQRSGIRCCLVNIARKIKDLMTAKPTWKVTLGGLQSRHYESYEQYLEHQKSKLGKIKSIEKKSSALKTGLKQRLPLVAAVQPGSSVLCLAARSGAECEAFLELGLFAIGIDLNPGPHNKLVLPGDFHAIQFASRSVDIVYTNSLDHSFDLPRVIAEVVRVLKPGGTFICEIVLGAEDENGEPPGDFEASWWNRADDVVEIISLNGLSLQSRSRFDLPWQGVQFVFLSLANKQEARLPSADAAAD
jgi:SAM-dependent methyltransferase